jgi:hypothetical protein
MNKLKILSGFLLISLIASELVGCSKSDIQANQVDASENNAATSPISSSSTPINQITPSSNPTPIVYDVICFQSIGAMCGNEETYKVPRGAKIRVSPKISTSVQGGSQTITSYESDKNTEKVSVAEMESLATEGANVYKMYYDSDFSSGGESTVEVKIYNSKLGEFKMFDREPSQVIFITGDTKLRVEKVLVKLGWTTEAIYKKISDSNNISSPKTASISSCPNGKKTFVTAETTNFLLYICGQNTPTDYVGVSKSTKKSIFLPLKSGNQFVAKNGEYTYTVTRQFLTIAEGRNIVKKEPIISYQ